MAETTNTTEDAEPQTPPPEPARLERATDGKILAGVAAGLGRRLDLAPWLIRIILIVLIPIGGLGLLLYLAGWLLMPEEGSDRSLTARWIEDLDGAEMWIGAGLLILGGLLLIGWLGFASSELVWAAVLIGLGILLYRGDLRLTTRADKRPPDQPGPEGDTGSTTEALPERADSDEGGEAPPPSPRHRPARPPRAPRPPRPRSVLGRLTFATLLLAIGVMALLDNAGVIVPTTRHYLAAAIGVVGLGLVVGAWFGRSRGLIFLGLLMIPFVLAASVADVRFNAEVGDPTYHPVSTDAVLAEYELGAGQLNVDLSDLEVGAQTVLIKASIGVGELRIVVPKGVTIDAKGRVGIGEVQILNLSKSGIDQELSVLSETPEDIGRIEIDAEAGFGAVHIRRSSS